MANKSKNKGKAYERDVAKHLSSVFELNFERVPNSGAFVGGKNASRVEKLSSEQMLIMDGDIIVPTELAHVSIECKFYKELRWSKLFTTGELNLNSWIDQVQISNKKIWFIFFKINRYGEYVVYDSKFADLLKTNGHFLNYPYKGTDHIITTMDNFFETNKQALLDMKD